MSRLVELARRSVTRTTAAIKAEQVASSAFCHEHAYDYVVVGAGSAGSVVANRLSEDSGSTVAVLEAGGWAIDPLIHIPAGVYSVFKDPSYNWNYMSEREPHCDNRRID
eukprot:gene3924-34028_t